MEQICVVVGCQIFSCAFKFLFLYLRPLKYQTPNAIAAAVAMPTPNVVGSANDMKLFAIYLI